MLYDTFGFPIELTRELASEKWFQIDEDWFQKEMEQQQERSRKWSKDKFTIDVDRWKHVSGLPATKFVWYQTLESDQINLLKDFEVQWQRILVFDKTPFYAESGWQVGDKWMIELDNWEKVKVKEVKKYEWVFLHFVE
jgi:alanyl-tRNA synthetase